MTACGLKTIDAVGKRLANVIADLSSTNQKYSIDYTYPSRRTFRLDENTMYVLRQHIDDEGTLHLVAGAKMAQEA